MLDTADHTEKHYDPMYNCEKWENHFFWACAGLSMIVPFSDKIPIGWLQQITAIMFILAVFIHSTLSNYSRFFLIPSAGTARCKQLLANAFKGPPPPETAQECSTHGLTPSITRLGASVLENSFWGKNVCREMAKKERIKVPLYFVLWLTAISHRSNDLDLVLALAQGLFSVNILFRWVKLEILRSQNETIFSQLYSHFLNRLPPTQKPGIPDILHSFAAYESAKATAAIKPSSKIFQRLTPRLSAEWDTIRDQLGIDK